MCLNFNNQNISAPEPSSEPTTATVGQCIELGFVDKLIKLWRLRRKSLEAKAEISVSGTLAKYTYKAGEAIMNKTLSYKSSYTSELFKARNATITKEEKNYICQYKALLLQ